MNDDDIEALVAEQRLGAAAEMCVARGDHVRASVLYERACAWDLAATAALEANDPARSLELAILGKNEAISHSAFSKITADEVLSVRCAERLSRRGDYAWAARLYEAAKRP